MTWLCDIISQQYPLKMPQKKVFKNETVSKWFLNAMNRSKDVIADALVLQFAFKKIDHRLFRNLNLSEVKLDRCPKYRKNSIDEEKWPLKLSVRKNSRHFERSTCPFLSFLIECTVRKIRQFFSTLNFTLRPARVWQFFEWFCPLCKKQRSKKIQESQDSFARTEHKKACIFI